MEEDFDGATMDACLIAAGQRAEHYEMAAYGTLVAWARAMGHEEAAELLQQTLDEEKAADEKLSGLAEGGINQSAAGEPMSRKPKTTRMRTTAGRVGRRRGRGSRRTAGRECSPKGRRHAAQGCGAPSLADPRRVLALIW